MTPVEANNLGKWPERLPWEGLLALVIKMTGARTLTLTAAGVAYAKSHRLDVTFDGDVMRLSIAANEAEPPKEAA